MITKKTIFTFMIAFSATSFTFLANATVINYAERSAFEAAISDMIIDDFNDSNYNLVNSSAEMKTLSAGSIGYESTFHSEPDSNVSFNNDLCWGCNGSGQIILDDTTIGNSSGVFGFGLDILDSDTYYHDLFAYVTYGDGSTENIALPTITYGQTPGFFGITSDLFINTVHFGMIDGGAGFDVFRVDNVTIGNFTSVPAPATLALFGLGLAGLGWPRCKKA